MAKNEAKKTIPLSTIPTSKLTVILNNFIVNTVNHLNKLSVNVDEKLSEFDKKMNDLEIMTTLFEKKFESLPDDIKSTFPELQQCSLDDVNPVFSLNEGENKKIEEAPQEQKKEGEENNNNEENKENKEVKEGEVVEEKKEEEKVEDANEELNPEEDLKKFLDQNSSFQNLYKMLKVGVPVVGVKQKAQINGFNMDLFEEMVNKIRKVNPNIS